jgi:lipopolysaccharide transport system permease protein
MAASEPDIVAEEARATPGAPEGRATLPAMSAGEAAVSIRHSSGGASAVQLLRQGIADLLSRRRLVRYLVQAEMKKRGSDTILGNVWWVLDPLLQMVVYVIFISIIGRQGAPDYPLFIFAAILPWKWFSAVISDATTSVVRHDRLIKQIAFPKLVMPMATTTAGVVGFIWGLIPLAIILILHIDSGRLTPLVLLLPVIAVVQFVFTLAVAILVSAANVFFRDLGNAISHALRLWWFLSPGLYSLAWLDDVAFVRENPSIAFLAGLNPFAVLFEAYRSILYGGPNGELPLLPNFISLGFLFLGSLLFLAICVIFFKRVEPDFAKVL